jgi:hypothetical protein
VSFLGAPAIDRGGISVWVVVGLVAFALTVGLRLFVLIPTSLIFALNGPQVYEALDEHATIRPKSTASSPTGCSRSTPPRPNRSRNAARFRDAALALAAQIALLAVALSVS